MKPVYALKMFASKDEVRMCSGLHLQMLLITVVLIIIIKNILFIIMFILSFHLFGIFFVYTLCLCFVYFASLLMLCAPVFIFTSGSSALLGRPRSGFSI